MVTPDSLTDAMVRAEWAAALDRGDREAAQLAQVALGIWSGAHEWICTRRNKIPACDICDGPPGDARHSDRARQRICDAINARKVTAETVTDEQIRELRALGEAPRLPHPRALRVAIRRALNVVERAGSNRARMKARGICPAAINARAGKER